MALVTVDELLERAEKGGYAVGAFNANNMEIVQAIMTAAEKEQAPVIMQASQGAIKYAGLTFLTGLVKLAAESSRVPIALHLDHGTDFEQVIRCIRSGFTSVMYDGSKLPLEENIAMSKKVLEIARPIGVSVEAELGKIGGTEDDIHVSEKEAMYTDPEEAKYFVEQTGIKSLLLLSVPLMDNTKENQGWIWNDFKKSRAWSIFQLYCMVLLECRMKPYSKPLNWECVR